MQLELRLFLLAIGLLIIGLIYAWGMRKNIKESLERRQRLKKRRSEDTLLDAMPVINDPDLPTPSSTDDAMALTDDFEVRVIDRTTEYQSKVSAAAKLDRRSEGDTDSVDWNEPLGQEVDQKVDEVLNEWDAAPVEFSAVPADAELESTAATEQELDDSPNADSQTPTMTVVLTVVAPNGQSFSGAGIRKVARELALPLGEQGVLECNTDTESGKRPKTVFSVAHLREPGTFNEATFDSLSTPGLLLFLNLPGPLSATEAVRMMFGVAGQLAEKLGGTVCDERKRRFTRDGYVELHHRASEFEQQ